MSGAIRLLLSDVDGTLVDGEKRLTDASVQAVRRLREAGVAFAVTSGRPPRGMRMLVSPLAIATPLAAFNGGIFVDDEMAVIEQRTIPAPLVPRIIDALQQARLSVWIYRGADWYVTDENGPHVQRESFTVQFSPTLVDSFEGLGEDVAKIVGVSDDHELVAAVNRDLQASFGDHVAASRSQPYYLDVTHPRANKGQVLRYLASNLRIPREQIGTIGDMPNDVLMFAESGLSIAMGQADREVQRAARRVTASNDDEGFAEAVDKFILGPQT